MTTLADDRYIVISSDGHAGGQMHEYRDYLEARYLDDFDEWAKSYVNPWTDLRGETAYRNWDSKARLQELEDDGVVAEVIFPNTIPPFFPSANLLAQFGGRLLHRLGDDVGDDCLHPLVGEALDEGTADATRATGHDGDLPGELSHENPLVVRARR